MIPIVQQTSEQFLRRIDTGNMCVMRLDPGTIVYVSERSKKGGDFISVKASNAGWYDLFSTEKELVTRKLLEDLNEEDNSRLVYAMQQKSSNERELRDLVTGSYEVRLPCDVAGEDSLVCTITILHGRGVVYGGLNVSFAETLFSQTSHGTRLEEFCMNVTYFGCVFGSVGTIKRVCEIIDENGLEGGFAWIRKVGVVTNQFYRGYNFLHHVGLAFWEPRLLPLILELFRRSLPKRLRGSQAEIARIYRGWLAVKTPDGETPLSAAVIGGNDAAVEEFLRFASTLHPVVERNEIAERYRDPKFTKIAYGRELRSSDRSSQAAAKIRALLEKAVRAAIDRSERVAKELLTQEGDVPPKKRKPTKGKSTAKKKVDAVERGEPSSSSTSDSKERDSANASSHASASHPGENSENARDDVAPCHQSLSGADSLPVDDPSTETSLEPLSDGRLCIICCEKPFSVALVPCGHVCLCRKCAEHDHLAHCPLCRRTVDSVLNLYCA